jgi:hypothetical protein
MIEVRYDFDARVTIAGGQANSFRWTVRDEISSLVASHEVILEAVDVEVDGKTSGQQGTSIMRRDRA